MKSQDTTSELHDERALAHLRSTVVMQNLFRVDVLHSVKIYATISTYFTLNF